jgi:PAS domain S-box-containing protein
LGANRPDSRVAVYRDIIIIVVSLVVITLLHYYTDVRARELHAFYTGAYFLPIIYGAFRFGLTGGLVTAIAASLLFVPHAQMSLGGFVGAYGTQNLVDVILYNVVGVATGLLATSLRREVERSRAVSQELESAYSHLEMRALELAKVREYVESILNSIVSGVFTIERTGEVAMANPAAHRILGLEVGTLAGMRLCDVWADDGGLCDQVETVLDGDRELTSGEIQAVTKGGKDVSLATHVARLIDTDGAILGGVVTMDDQTEVKALTEQLARADRLAALGELVAGVAHEIRNPLAVIKGSLQVYEETGGDPAELEELTDVVSQEIERLDKVIKGLLDFGKPAPPEVQPVDPVRLFEETVTLAGKYAEQQGVEIVVRPPDGAPAILADPDQLKQVMVNLITNAVQAMPEGGEVTLGVREAAGRVAITVSDQGSGMPPGEVSKVFDPFHTGREDGTGLGLTIVHRIIDEHRGTIAVDSALGEGTTFTVSLPVAPAE